MVIPRHTRGYIKGVLRLEVSGLGLAQDRLVLPGSGSAGVNRQNLGNPLLATILLNPDLHRGPTRQPHISGFLEHRHVHEGVAVAVAQRHEAKLFAQIKPSA